MNLEELLKQLAALTAAVHDMQNASKGEDVASVGLQAGTSFEAPETADEDDVVIDDYGISFNLWDEYYARLAQKETPMAPNLHISEGAEIFGNWALDGDAFIFVPAQLLKEKWLSGKGIRYGHMTKESAARIRRYAALHCLYFATRYVTMPPGFVPSGDYLSWVRKNHHASQGTKIMLNRGVDYIQSAVYGQFVGNEPILDTVLPATKLVSGGNLYGDEDLLDSLQRGNRAFETNFNASNFGVQRSLMDSAKWALRRLDAEYSAIPDDEAGEALRTEFMTRNPGYITR